MMIKAYSEFIKRPIPPKVKKTRFKIINKIHPVAEFPKKDLNIKLIDVHFVMKPWNICSYLIS